MVSLIILAITSYLFSLKSFSNAQDSLVVSRSRLMMHHNVMTLFSGDEEIVVRTIDNHMIIKNLISKNNHQINCEILKFLW